jgi:hypothetical protein
MRPPVPFPDPGFSEAEGALIRQKVHLLEIWGIMRKIKGDAIAGGKVRAGLQG